MAVIHENVSYSGNAETDFILSTWKYLPPNRGNVYTWSITNETYIENRTPTPETYRPFAENHEYIEMIRYTLNKFSSFANVTFQEVNESTGENGDIRFWSCEDRNFNTTGKSVGDSLDSDSKSIVLKTYPSTSAFVPYQWTTVAHEMGHLMGLNHTQSSVNDRWYEDTYRSDVTMLDTVMSYNLVNNKFHQPQEKTALFNSDGEFIGEARVKNFGIYDIQTLQYIYGANYDYNSGTNVYKYSPDTLNYFDTIWDGGGYDTLDFSDFKLGSVINMNGGTRSSVYMPIPELAPSIGTLYEELLPYDGTNAIGLAYGVNIERVIGTQGDDIVYGNALSNIIYGKKGNDQIYGEAGNDFIYGDDGNDIIYGGIGDDTLYAGSGNNILYGGYGNDNLYSLDNGHDVLYGGDGNDKYRVNITNSHEVIELASEGRYDWIYYYGEVNTDITVVMPDNIEYADTTFINSYGKGQATIIGNDLNNAINGRVYADDVLSGGKGDDLLQGYSGSDTYIFNRGDGHDTIIEYNNNEMGLGDTDTLLFGDDISYNQLWFTRETDSIYDNLVINIINSTDQVIISNWFDKGLFNQDAKIEAITTKDGFTFTINQVEDLVNIMSAYKQPTTGYSTIIDDYLLQNTLIPIT